MKPETKDDIWDLLKGHFATAALGAALERGLFWVLAKRPMEPAEIGNELSIPENRCRNWLQLLGHMGLVEHTQEGYVPSGTARSAILDAYSQELWAFLAQEERERLPILLDLPRHIGDPRSLWSVHGLTAPDYLEQIRNDPDRARRFTRMLYEFHQPLAESVAETLDMTGVDRLLDLGGGSGVVSLKLLKRYPDLFALVVDIPNVCAAGREIADETTERDRIEYVALDFVKDPLPSRFDMILACDSADYDEPLFRKIHPLLNPEGRFVIVDQLASEDSAAPRERVTWSFRSSLGDPEYPGPTTLKDIKELLIKTGFGSTAVTALDNDWYIIESRD
jgi:SAM-dependent methyltransferase